MTKVFVIDGNERIDESVPVSRSIVSIDPDTISSEMDRSKSVHKPSSL